MKKRLKKFGRFLFWMFSFVLLFVVGGTLALLRWPNALLNDRMLQRFATLGAVYLDRTQGIDLRWKSASLHVDSQSLLKKRISLSFDGICARQRDDQYRVCFEHLETAAVVDWTKLVPRLRELGPTKLLGGDASYDARVALSPAKAVPVKNSQPAVPGKPAFLSETRLRFVRLEIRSWHVRTANDHFQGALDLRSVERGDHLKFDLHAGANDAARGQKRKAVAVDTDGTLAPDRIALTLNATATNFSPQFTRLEVRDCTLELKTDDGSFRCPARLKLPDLPIEVSKLDFPKRADFLIQAKAKGKIFPPDLSKPMDATMDLEWKKFATKSFDGGGHVTARFHGTSAELSRKEGLEADLALFLSVPRFESAVTLLGDGPYAVPAPLRILKGQIGFRAEGRADLAEGRFPFVFRTRLASTHQAIDTDTSGALHFVSSQDGGMHLNLELETALSHVQIELPRLELSRPPQLNPDPRLVKAVDKPKAMAGTAAPASNFGYSIHVMTPPGHPVKIVSNLAKTPVPIDLDIRQSSDHPLSGTVAAESFPLELFRRDASLEHFRLTLREPMESSLIDGEIGVKYVDYTIRVLVLNTVGKPAVKLTSDPPMPENQLVSALLFGRTLDELDPSQSASVGSTRAAVADGAIGLASLYVLASTPVQSVGYDPQTGVFSAKVRLAEGTSLNLGADSSSLAEVGVRKRLGAHWAIETGLEHPTDPSSRTLSALLEWSMRY